MLIDPRGQGIGGWRLCARHTRKQGQNNTGSQQK